MIACWTRNEPATETSGPQRIVCKRSTDGGRTWRPRTRVAVSPPEQGLVIGADVVPDTRDEDTFYVFWNEYLSGILDGSGTDTIQMSKTTDGGARGRRPSRCSASCRCRTSSRASRSGT
jgi:hypothetical protein